MSSAERALSDLREGFVTRSPPRFEWDTFLNPKTGLRVDLLFDFPIPAAMLAEQATRTTIRSHVFEIASEPDLLRLKRIAGAARSAPGDAEDIAFLESRRKRSR